MENNEGVPVMTSDPEDDTKIYTFFWDYNPEVDDIRQTTTIGIWMDGEKRMVASDRDLTDLSERSEKVMAFLKDYFSIKGVVGVENFAQTEE